jgi:hypothetical protein
LINALLFKVSAPTVVALNVVGVCAVKCMLKIAKTMVIKALLEVRRRGGMAKIFFHKNDYY